MAQLLSLENMKKYLWLTIFFVVFIWSGINPKDPFTWFLEILPALLGFIILALTYKRFRLTRLSYILILIHSIILMVGGHYTYSQVPLFDWLKDVLELERNNYDKVGHLAQGFIPAIITREVLIRKNVIAAKKWLSVLVVAVCLAISALYELLEWGVALLAGGSADAFLGTQGYVWDTQSDMFLALVGAVLALFFLHSIHDRQLKEIGK